MPENEYFLAIPAVLFFVMAYLAKTGARRRRLSLLGFAVLASLLSRQMTIEAVGIAFAALAVLLAILAVLIGRDEERSENVTTVTRREQQ